jgi:hypothetical protein
MAEDLDPEIAATLAKLAQQDAGQSATPKQRWSGWVNLRRARSAEGRY